MQAFLSLYLYPCVTWIRYLFPALIGLVSINVINEIMFIQVYGDSFTVGSQGLFHSFSC